ncbi:toxin TumE [Dactylococcopsis salina]|uniref:Uncharacterized protein n=1 Tax=Dactylococcopsis salina (strain PCC 8305) TaxID=13035 RepID=K9YX54_DACS8|nr:DUF6516 family protein [Dactylococcopsis salina]AFZ51092.1 hypothetical protein Dacsa_2501 [Dactylococcopsis salina PCC 8305]
MISLLKYFDRVEACLSQYSAFYVEQFQGTLLTSSRANLRLRVRANQVYLLAVSEAILVVEGQITYLDYRYHFQDGENQLIFRYDSTPHFPDLETFPDHKHLKDRVIASQKPDLSDVLQEVARFLEG